MAKYWQIAAGYQGRRYGELFLKYGMAFIGDKTRMDKVSVGDILVLKDGKTAIRAVGEVQRNADGDKDWLKDFDGWDLSHYKYVNWKIPLNGKEGVKGLGLVQGMLKRIHKQQLRQRVDTIWAEGGECKPCEEPKPTNQVTDKELLRFLLQQGFRPSSADELIRTISKVRLLADYYYEYKKKKDIRERETRTFLVVPLLLALGWSEQQLKIEQPCGRKRADIACFRPIYNGSHEDCVSVIETKGFSIGLEYAQKQAIEYAGEFPNCRTMVLTNGYCYKVFVKDDDGFTPNPTAYLNLRDPRQRYPLDPENVDGACRAIKCLLPN